ncbi:MAG: hypothetical protein U5K31_05630 [Balneolaceae bacterium]|nr:hypothetical protein [Balneolaceae bacterium]
MPLNKNAYLRYQVIDECLRKKSMAFPSTEKLLEEIERLYLASAIAATCRFG